MCNMTEQEYINHINYTSHKHSINIVVNEDVKITNPHSIYHKNTVYMPLELYRVCTFDEMNAILCHELAHIKLKHEAILSIFDYTGMELSRKQEYEADRYAIKVLHCSCISFITGVVKLYKLLGQQLSFYCCKEHYTHPGLFNRFGALGYTLSETNLIELIEEKPNVISNTI